MKQSVLTPHVPIVTKITACLAVLALTLGIASVATANTAGCDPQQFAGERHYIKVRMNGDRVASMHMIRTKDHKEVATSYPYGLSAAISTADTREQCMKVKELKTGSSSSSTSVAADTGSIYTTGLPIGWTPSTGLTPGLCYQFTTSQPTGREGNETFSSKGAADSVAEQTRVSTTISGAYGFLSVGASASYSDQWQASANSGSAYFNLSSIWKLNNTLDLTNPLTQEGKNAVTQGNFGTLCGLQYLNEVTGGMIATFSVAYGSSSASTKKTMDGHLKVKDAGLGSVSLAASAAKSDTSSSSYITAKLTIIGGGNATNGLLTAFGDIEDCNPGNTSSSSSACASFIKGMESAGSAAWDEFNGQANSIMSGTNPGFALFPNGIAGVSGTMVLANPPQNVTVGNDLLKPYTTQLTQYLTLFNEIATLNNRVGHLYRLINGTDYNPLALDLAAKLELLMNTSDGSYSNDRVTLKANLSSCLRATKGHVKTKCAPIITNTIDSAYTWYDAQKGNPNCKSNQIKASCWRAQQNTIALQYTAVFTGVGSAEWPDDVMYIDSLPPFTGTVAEPIGSKAALVAFTDRPFYYNQNLYKLRDVSILGLKNNTDLSKVYTSVQPITGPPFKWYGIARDAGWYDESNFAYVNWISSTTCTPTFHEPCAINFEWKAPATVNPNILIQTTNPIAYFFVPD